MESRQETWTLNNESDLHATYIVNYESKTHSINNSEASGSFNFLLRIQAIDRILIRSRSGHETLLKQRNLGDEEDAEVKAILSDIPRAFLDEEETCNRYVTNVLSKANINEWIQERVVSNISKDAMKRLHGEEEEKKGFIVEVVIEIVKETSMGDDLDGRNIPIEQDCAICLKELSSTKKKIMMLPCSHSFHRDCVLSWLRRKPSCPYCRDDINNPRPKRKLPINELMFL